MIVGADNASDSGAGNSRAGNSQGCAHWDFTGPEASSGTNMNSEGLYGLVVYHPNKNKSRPPTALCSFINHSSTVASGKMGTELGLKSEQIISI